jgi:cyclopropane-fatty-acyl-phospholipid synthase
MTQRTTGATEPLIGGLEGAGARIWEIAREGIAGVRALGARATSSEAVARRTRDHVTSLLRELPWRVRVTDWGGATYDAGGSAPHWSGHDALRIRMKTVEAGHDLLALDIMRFLERHLDGEVDLEGNLFLLSEIRNYAKLELTPFQALGSRIRNFAFQDRARARVNVKNHYDIDQRALNAYLDKVYLSYSCAIWKDPACLSREGVLEVGRGEGDERDTLEAAQWRKFAHAADFLAPGPDETVLDIGCGYGGLLRVLLDRHRPKRVVGWTHSANQVLEAKRVLGDHDPSRYEVNEGDYREDARVYDHAHSCGMACHVGPRGLVPYVRWVRAHLRTGGRYLHHVIMTPYSERPLEEHLGPSFHMRYVWPGFYWFTLGQHVEALERNGFHVTRVFNLSPHYAKTTFAWYERLISNEAAMIEAMGEPTYRAWRVFLAGSTASFLNRSIHVYRILCEATDPERPSAATSDPRSNVAAHMPIG